MVIHIGFVRVLRGLLARFMRRTLRGTGWKPVFRDRLEAYPTSLCVVLRVLCASAFRFQSPPAGAEQAGSLSSL
jgi:hypothetical protein